MTLYEQGTGDKYLKSLYLNNWAWYHNWANKLKASSFTKCQCFGLKLNAPINVKPPVVDLTRNKFARGWDFWSLAEFGGRNFWMQPLVDWELRKAILDDRERLETSTAILKIPRRHADF